MKLIIAILVLAALIITFSFKALITLFATIGIVATLKFIAKI